MSEPVLSIVMPVFNAEPFIFEAVSSLLNQSFYDFELIIVDDGCTDKSIDIVKSFNDERIRLITNEQNSGIVFSRNRGIELARGRYIAPFDADDIAEKDKFQKQINFLENNKDYGIIGSWALLIDKNGKKLKKKWKVNAPADRIPVILLFRNYFIQSAVVIRREALPTGNYTKGFDAVEDYKMWFEISRKYKVWNYPEYLLKYRIHDSSITQKQKQKMAGRDIKVFDYIFNTLGYDLSDRHKELLLYIKGDTLFNESSLVKETEQFLIYLLELNRDLQEINHHELIKVVYNRWLKICFQKKPFSLRSLLHFIASPLNRIMVRSLFQK
ncbi:MAG: glycosyltransferase family 2 protein [Bacteroidales bacterium]